MNGPFTRAFLPWNKATRQHPGIGFYQPPVYFSCNFIQATYWSAIFGDSHAQREFSLSVVGLILDSFRINMCVIAAPLSFFWDGTKTDPRARRFQKAPILLSFPQLFDFHQNFLPLFKAPSRFIPCGFSRYDMQDRDACLNFCNCSACCTSPREGSFKKQLSRDSGFKWGFTAAAPLYGWPVTNCPALLFVITALKEMLLLCSYCAAVAAKVYLKSSILLFC